MRSFAGSIADGVPFKFLPAPKIRKVRGRRKRKKDMLGWLNASLKSTETRDELSTTLYLQSNK